MGSPLSAISFCSAKLHKKDYFFDLNRSVIAEFYGVQRKIPMDEVLSNESEILGNHAMQAYKYPKMLAMIQAGILKH